MYECEIGAQSFVGPYTEIQKGVRIGQRTRVQSHCFVCSNVTVGDDCFVGHGVMFTNDTFSDGTVHYDEKDWGKTTVGNRVLIGSNATLMPVTVCDGAIIGAGAVVTRDITEPGKYVGAPAKRLADSAAGSSKRAKNESAEPL
jgi:acetyltransferase-like isoleucine patch superfamily enzyme